nr:hypothetical protein [Saprospiraceae bacterium]
MIVLKASKISHLTDARYFSAKGASIMGFDLDPRSPDFISPDQLHAIADWVDGVNLAGEFGLNPPEEILHLAQSLNLEYIQLPHFYESDRMGDFKGHKIIKTIIVERGVNTSSLAHRITDWAPHCRAVELDFQAQGINPLAEEGIGISGLNELLDLHQCFIKAPLTLDSIAHIQKLNSYPGITFSGSHEEKVGFKSFEDIDAILDYLEEIGWFDPYFYP